MMKRIMLLTIAALFLQNISADRRDAVKAQAKANEFYSRVCKSPADMQLIQHNLPMREKGDGEADDYFVFTPEGEKGFIIISGSTQLPDVVGYSPTDDFNINNMPDALKSFLEAYSDYVDSVEDGEAEVSIGNSAVRSSRSVVAPMLQTHWNQGSPYWNMCPIIDGVNTYSGCVATAMAQVMKYYNYPTSGSGQATNSVSSETIDFSQSVYDWDNMLNDYLYYYEGDQLIPAWSQTEADAVAKLMIDCGYAVGMEYSTSASGAITSMVSNALVNNFGYSPNLKYLPRSAYNTYNWISMVRQNLEAGMPLIYSGRGDQGGHAFVCDGIDADNLMHINWGWSGYCDGYYDIDILAAAQDGSIAGSFNQNQAAIFGIRPIESTESASDYALLPTLCNSLTITSQTSTLLYQSVKVNAAKIENCTGKDLTGSFGYRIFDSEGNVAYSATTYSNISFAAGTYYSNLAFTFKLSYVSPGDYTIVLSWQNENGVWSDLAVGDCIDRIYASKTLTETTFSLPSEFAAPIVATLSTIDDTMFVGKEFNITTTLTNYNSTDTTDEIRLAIIPSDEYSDSCDLADYAVTEFTPVTIAASSTTSIEFSNLKLDGVGEYILATESSSGTMECVSLTLKAVEASMPQVVGDIIFNGDINAGSEVEIEFSIISATDYNGYLRLALVSNESVSSPQAVARRFEVENESTTVNSDDSYTIAEISLTADMESSIIATVPIAKNVTAENISLSMEFTDPLTGEFVQTHVTDQDIFSDITVTEYVAVLPIITDNPSYENGTDIRPCITNYLNLPLFAEDTFVGEIYATCIIDNFTLVDGEIVAVNLSEGETSTIALPVAGAPYAYNGTFRMSIFYKADGESDFIELATDDYAEDLTFSIINGQTDVALNKVEIATAVSTPLGIRLNTPNKVKATIADTNGLILFTGIVEGTRDIEISQKGMIIIKLENNNNIHINKVIR